MRKESGPSAPHLGDNRSTPTNARPPSLRAQCAWRCARFTTSPSTTCSNPPPPLRPLRRPRFFRSAHGHVPDLQRVDRRPAQARQHRPAPPPRPLRRRRGPGRRRSGRRRRGLAGGRASLVHLPLARVRAGVHPQRPAAAGVRGDADEQALEPLARRHPAAGALRPFLFFFCFFFWGFCATTRQTNWHRRPRKAFFINDALRWDGRIEALERRRRG